MKPSRARTSRVDTSARQPSELFHCPVQLLQTLSRLFPLELEFQAKFFLLLSGPVALAQTLRQFGIGDALRREEQIFRRTGERAVEMAEFVVYAPSVIRRGFLKLDQKSFHAGRAVEGAWFNPVPPFMARRCDQNSLSAIFNQTSHSSVVRPNSNCLTVHFNTEKSTFR